MSACEDPEGSQAVYNGHSTTLQTEAKNVCDISSQKLWSYLQDTTVATVVKQ